MRPVSHCLIRGFLPRAGDGRRPGALIKQTPKFPSPSRGIINFSRLPGKRDRRGINKRAKQAGHARGPRGLSQAEGKGRVAEALRVARIAGGTRSAGEDARREEEVRDSGGEGERRRDGKKPTARRDDV